MISFTSTCRVLTLLLTLAFVPVLGQRMTAEEYIRQYREAAIEDMKKTGVPASITLAQGMYESDFGNSPLAKNARNHFGIKCHKEWNGPTFHQDDDAANECFRVYENVLQSYDDHSNFLRSRERYSSLFTLETTDYKGWAHGLKKAGYATNPHYASKLIELIERYNLGDYDKGIIPPPAPVLASADPAVTPATKKTIESPATVVVPVAQPTFNAPVLTSANEINEIPFVRARKGDSWLRIANENNLELWEILEFNEVDKNASLRENDIVFLKAKKMKCEQVSHVLRKGETLHAVSQMYGVRLSRLYSRNHIKPGATVEPGTKLYLKMNKSFYE